MKLTQTLFFFFLAALGYIFLKIHFSIIITIKMFLKKYAARLEKPWSFSRTPQFRQPTR